MEETVQDRAAKLYDDAEKSVLLFDVYRMRLQQQELISGKTIREWKEYFHIEIPESPDPEICKQLDMRLADLHQDATFYLSLAQLCKDKATLSSSTKFEERYKSICDEFRGEGYSTKLPAAGTIEALVNAELVDINSIVQIADRETKFWKNIKEHLDMIRRLINDATMNNGIQVKIDAMSSR